MFLSLDIVGAGMIVKEVLPVLEALNIPVHCVYARREESFTALERPELTYYSDYAEMLANSPATAVYLGITNEAHYDFAVQAIQAGKHLIIEKPLCPQLNQVEELLSLAQQQGVWVIEAVTTYALPNYARVAQLLERIGPLTFVNLNFSQYSSRYDRFLQGDIAPAFSLARAGGALMDLNVYNLHFLTGLFGSAQEFSYTPNIVNDVDTSGMLHLTYEACQAVAIASKDCNAPIKFLAQGQYGYIYSNDSCNILDTLYYVGNDGVQEEYTNTQDLDPQADAELIAALDAVNPNLHRLVYEFHMINELFVTNNYAQVSELNEISMQVAYVLEQARLSNGLYVPGDAEYVEAEEVYEVLDPETSLWDAEGDAAWAEADFELEAGTEFFAADGENGFAFDFEDEEAVAPSSESASAWERAASYVAQESVFPEVDAGSVDYSLANLTMSAPLSLAQQMQAELTASALQEAAQVSEEAWGEFAANEEEAFEFDWGSDGEFFAPEDNNTTSK